MNLIPSNELNNGPDRIVATIHIRELTRKCAKCGKTVSQQMSVIMSLVDTLNVTFYCEEHGAWTETLKINCMTFQLVPSPARILTHTKPV